MKNTLLLLLFSFATCSLFAQWTNDTEANTPVASSKTSDIQSIETSDGRTYVAYWHEVPAPANYEMRLQLLDENGNQQFGPDGMLVNDTAAMSTYTTLWSLSVDAQNNFYVCFNETGGSNRVYVHKISPDGTQLWGPTGISPGAGFDPKALPLRNGEVVICWLPGNQGVMQKVSADGTPVWANPVTIAPGVSGHKSSAGELAELSNGDFVVIIHDRGGFSPSSLPYAQRYDTNGTAVWANPVAISTTYYTVFNSRYALRQDGDVLYFGYAGAKGLQFYGFVQRIDPDGSLPWGIDGVDFSTQTAFYERSVQIAYEPGSDVVWAICEYSDVAQGQVGEYVQKLDKVTGARLLTDEGKEIFPVSAAYISHRGELQLVNDQPVFLISDGDSNGVFPKDILAVYLDSTGDFAWPGHTKPIGTNPDGVKSRIQLNTPYNGQITCAWAEERPGIGESRAFAQNLRVTCNAPVADFSYTVNNWTVSFASKAADADSLVWDFGDGTTGSGAEPSHNYAAQGTYDVCQYAFNACGSDTTCQTITLEASGVSLLEKIYHLAVSPNPNHGACRMAIDLPEAATLSYSLITANGRVVKDGRAELAAGHQVISLAQDLAKGCYFLRVEVLGKIGVVRLVVR